MHPKIFISSTCFDLIDLRAEIKVFLDELGLKPIMSDQANSDFEVPANSNSIDTCLVNLRNADVVIFFLSKRYGPSLGKLGFENISATHLEYREARKHNKHILFFVRDRLEADFLAFERTKDLTSLSWIIEKDISLFDFFKEHKKLSNTNTNNWYWSFKSSLDVKERLSIELKTQIVSARLNKIIESGFAPYISITCKPGILNRNEPNGNFEFIIENLGTQPAIDPIMIITKAKSYKEVIDEGYYTQVLANCNHKMKSMKQGDQNLVYQVLSFEEEFRFKSKAEFVIEVVYKTIFGDVIADISEVKIDLRTFPDVIPESFFRIKRYINDKAFDRLYQG